MASETSHGIGFVGAMQLVFIVLKLTKVVDWSWWFTLLPAEISAVMVIIGMIIYFIVMRNQ